MATAIVAGLWLGHRQAKREHLPADDIISCGQWAILAGLVGARLYEVLFNWDYYGRYPWKIIAVWEGGLAIHGGRSEEHTSELQSLAYLVCRLLLEKKKKITAQRYVMM